MASRIETYEHAGLRFDVHDAGPLDGTPVVLLHGFPQDARSWDRLAPLLHARGYRTLAPDQRGYSPGARPTRRRDYALPVLADDVCALIDLLPDGRAHVVGHDWGAAVGWQLAGTRAERLRSLAALSVPHPAAFVRALTTSRQGLRSWYMAAFQLPVLPELALGRTDYVARTLERSGMPAAAARRDAERFTEPGAARGALNWYRAIALQGRGGAGRAKVPTLHVWSDRDVALGPKGAQLTERFVAADYRFVALTGVSHWIPETAAEELDPLLAEHFERAG